MCVCVCVCMTYLLLVYLKVLCLAVAQGSTNRTCTNIIIAKGPFYPFPVQYFSGCFFSSSRAAVTNNYVDQHYIITF